MMEAGYDGSNEGRYDSHTVYQRSVIIYNVVIRCEWTDSA